MSKESPHADAILRAAINDPEPIIRRKALDRIDLLSNPTERDQLLESRYQYVLSNQKKYLSADTRSEVISDHLGVIENVHLHSSPKYGDSVYKTGIQHSDPFVRRGVVNYSVTTWPEREKLLVASLKDPETAKEAYWKLSSLPSWPAGNRRCGHIITALKTSDQETCLDILRSFEYTGYLSDAHVDSILKTASKHPDKQVSTEAERLIQEKAAEKAERARYKDYRQNLGNSGKEPFANDPHGVFDGITNDMTLSEKLKTLKSNYRKLSLKEHPDKVQDQGDKAAVEAANVRFKDLGTKYSAREKYYKDELEKEEQKKAGEATKTATS